MPALMQRGATAAARSTLIVLCVVALALAYSSKSAQVLWVDRVGTSDGDEGVNRLVTEANGGVYATSTFANRQRGSGEFVGGGTAVRISAETGAIIGKWNRLGALEWLRIAERLPEEEGVLAGGVVSGMPAVSPDNSVYWHVSANNNRVSIAGVTYTNETIIQKLSSTGQLQWTRNPEGPRTSLIAADMDGNYAILRRPNTESAGILIEKYSDAGSALWTRVGAENTMFVGGGGQVLPRAMQFDRLGEMRVLCFLSSSRWSGVLRFGQMTIEADPERALGFLLALRSDGSDKWLVAFRGSTQVLEVSSAQVASNGDTYICGYYSGSLTISDKIMRSPGKISSFAAKIDTEGRLVWAVDTVGLDSGLPTVYFLGLSVDERGSCYLCGSFQGIFRFGNSILQGPEVTLSGFGPESGFVAKLGVDGAPVWARQYGGIVPNDTRISSIVAASPDELTVGGTFAFSSVKFEDYTLLPAGKYDGFVTRLSDVPSDPPVAPPLLAPRLYFGMSVTGLLNRTYAIEASDSANGTNWISVTNLIIDRSPKQWIDSDPISPLRRFYRAVLK